MARDRFRQRAFDGSIQVSSKFETDKDIKAMRAPFNHRFFEVFAEGFELYIAGKWAEARRILEAVEAVKGFEDYPTRNILSVMEESNYRAPKDWGGFRVLTEK
mmetsp:Transcript_21846/g.16202  ORF Transcript_21846/g.16202 Transcript_21846/m.16202 type:complete len:103 (+) Transcript_21846:465-773(+)